MKIKAIAPWYGSKRTLAPEIIRQLGPHSAYWELFCGSCAVLLAKPLELAMEIGCDSVDGSSLSMFGDKYIHKFCAWARHLEQQPNLFQPALTPPGEPSPPAESAAPSVGPRQ